MNNDRWHFDKTLSVTHIISTAMIVVSLVWWGAGIDKRISSNEQRDGYIQEVQIRDRNESRRNDEETKNELEKINEKLDKLIERMVNNDR